jgi:hypothetical protein
MIDGTSITTTSKPLPNRIIVILPFYFITKYHLVSRTTIQNHYWTIYYHLDQMTPLHVGKSRKNKLFERISPKKKENDLFYG